MVLDETYYEAYISYHSVKGNFVQEVWRSETVCFRFIGWFAFSWKPNRTYVIIFPKSVHDEAPVFTLVLTSQR